MELLLGTRWPFATNAPLARLRYQRFLIRGAALAAVRVSVRAAPSHPEEARPVPGVWVSGWGE